jgi:hypothetical protein
MVLRHLIRLRGSPVTTRQILIGPFSAVVVLLAVAGCSADSGQPSAGPSNSQAGSSGANPVALCMRDRGWAIEVVNSESWKAPGVTEGQWSAYMADSQECAAQHEVIERPEDVPDERWEQTYTKTVESAECLRSQGYDIPETPSFQVWKDSYFVDGGANQWVPWGFVPVPSMDREEFSALEAICPQVLL